MEVAKFGFARREARACANFQALDQIVLRAFLNGLHRSLLIVGAGQQDNRCVGRGRADPPDRLRHGVLHVDMSQLRNYFLENDDMDIVIS